MRLAQELHERTVEIAGATAAQRWQDLTPEQVEGHRSHDGDPSDPYQRWIVTHRLALAATVEGIGTDGDRWVAIIRAVKPPITPTPLTMIDDTATEAACCGVTACCMPGEHATDPATTIAEAKTAAGCACTD